MRSVEDQRKAVCDEAKSWLLTPYHHMARVKGAGVDCATLLAEVYHAAGLIDHSLAISYYPPDWALHRDEERYLQIVIAHMREISEEEALAGDVVLYKIGRAFAHGGIILAWPQIIHAVWQDAVLLGDGLADGKLSGRPRRFFSPWSK
jgi:cell wall-associated NlpC family hydrolase